MEKNFIPFRFAIQLLMNNKKMITLTAIKRYKPR